MICIPGWRQASDPPTYSYAVITGVLYHEGRARDPTVVPMAHALDRDQIQLDQLY